jgi:hypothetical protein
MFVQGMVGLAALLVVIYISVQLLNLQPENATPEPPTEVAAVAGPPTETYTPTWTPQPTLGESEIVAAADSNNSDFFASGVSIEIELLQRSWMRVIADGVEQFSGIATEGETFRSEASQQIELSVANAAAVMINFNGRDLEPLGVRGQQVDVVFSPSGMDVDEANEGLQPTQPVTNTPIEPTLPMITPETTPIGSVDTQNSSPSATPLFATESDASVPTSTPVSSTGGDPDFVPPSWDGPASPTPLFGTGDNPAPTDSAASNDSTTGDAAQPQPTALLVETATPTIEPTVAPTATPVPTQTNIPQPTAILPPRATPSNLPTQKP